MKTVGIVGAGIIGRLLALGLESRWRVTVLDEGDSTGSLSCSFAAAGMLCPFSELETAEPAISEWGRWSLERWPTLLKTLEMPVYFQRQGSLAVAHPRERAELDRLRARSPEGVLIGPDELRRLEPDLPNGFSQAVYFADEGHLDPRQVLAALHHGLQRRGVKWEQGVRIIDIAPHRVRSLEQKWEFDWVIDCRGLGAREDLSDLRGVRGEWILVHTEEVRLGRPVRLMHPRYPLYVVPRPHGNFLVGATSIESEDKRPISVRSLLELLSAAFSLHPSFAEGSVVETAVQCRPAFPHHLPEARWTDGLLRVNGLYRHGFLVGPWVADSVAAFLESQIVEPGFFRGVA